MKNLENLEKKMNIGLNSWLPQTNGDFVAHQMDSCERDYHIIISALAQASYSDRSNTNFMTDTV